MGPDAHFEVLREAEPDNVAFERFHRANPHVLVAFAAIARELRDGGVPAKRASIWTLVHRWRWLALFDATRGPVAGPQKPVFRSAFAPFYARVIHAACPDLNGFLKLATMREQYDPDLMALGIVALPPPPPPPGAAP